MPSFLPSPWSPNPNDPLTQRAESVLQGCMGLRGHAPLEMLHGPDSLSDAWLWRLGDQYILKSVSATSFHLETTALARDLLLACTGISGIPRLIHAGPPVVEAGRVWVLLEWLPGDPWNPLLVPMSGMYANACALLDCLHDRSRSVLGCRHGVLPCVAMRRHWLARLGELLAQLAYNGRIDTLEKQLVQCLNDRHRDFERAMVTMPIEGPMVVIHGDPRPANWLFHGGTLTGLIDYGACRWDHPISDLARLASGIPGANPRDELTANLARTNRWGSMTRWLARLMESDKPWSAVERQRVEELLWLDNSDRKG